MGKILLKKYIRIVETETPIRVKKSFFMNKVKNNITVYEYRIVHFLQQ